MSTFTIQVFDEVWYPGTSTPVEIDLPSDVTHGAIDELCTHLALLEWDKHVGTKHIRVLGPFGHVCEITRAETMLCPPAPILACDDLPEISPESWTGFIKRVDWLDGKNVLKHVEEMLDPKTQKDRPPL